MTNQPVNVTEIYLAAKAQWLGETRRKLDIRDVLIAALPYFLIIIQVAFFLLSATHTITMINKLAPGVGLAAAIGFELGLVVLSLMIYTARKNHETMPIWWTLSELLLFILIVGANFGGSVAAVMAASDIKTLSFDGIILGFGRLAFTDQIALVLAIMFSLIVPIGSIVVGQGVAHQILDRDQSHNQLEGRWARVAFTELYRAFYSAHVDAGYPLSEAKTRARTLATGFSTVRQREVKVAAEPIKVAAASLPRDRSAFGRAMDAYERGLSPADVVEQKIAKRQTAYNSWRKYQERHQGE